MYRYKGVELEVRQEDIVKLKVDVIVNAANNTLLGGGGVDGAIHLAGGSEILEQCKKIGGCPTGEARITVGGNLAAKYIIHTVGPKYKNSNKPEEELKRAYSNSLKLAVEYGLNTIAFPSISTGAYGYPIKEAVRIALTSIISQIDKGLEIKKIIFVLYSGFDYKVYREYFDKNLL